MTRFAIQRVTATPTALELIERLTDRHGPVCFLQSGSLEGLERVHFVCRSPFEVSVGN
jgi:uncharacterized protein (DUF779 family)